ncbi:MFS transporter [Quadrisphaera oryzae]|uniref:MFS transporter n=1 Tax=Quadrisphaera TaxID=317661 RepID=UPI0016451ECA|nr:MFS transporter [Quadrisphaera sp. RL12-1S]MBC3763236.1 MFS transporter [Quadrisphaera sp. RL12-1S]
MDLVDRTDPVAPGLLRAPEGRDFRRLWAGDSVSQGATQVGDLVVPLLAVTVLAATPLQMGVLSAAQSAAFLLLGLPAGAWVDRWSKRRVLLLGNLVRAVALAVLPLAWWAGVLSLPLVVAVAFVVGVATLFFDVAYQSYLPSLVRADRLGEGNSLLQVSASVAQVGGPAVGGWLARLLGAPLAVAVSAVAFAASSGLLSRISHVEPPPDRSARRSLRAEVAEGLSFVVHQPLLRRIVATTSLSNLGGSASSALLVLYAVRQLGLSEGQVGTALGIGAAGALLGALTVQRVVRAVGEGRTIALSLLPGIAAGALLPLAAPLVSRGSLDDDGAVALLAVSGAVIGVSVVLYNVAQVTYRQRITPAPLLGRMNASVRFLVWGTMPIGALLGGALGERVGLVPMLWTALAVEALGVLPVLLSPLLRSGPAAAPEAPADGGSAEP